MRHYIGLDSLVELTIFQESCQMSFSTTVSTKACEISLFPTELGWFGFALIDEQIFCVTIGDASRNAARSRLENKLSQVQLILEQVESFSDHAHRLQNDLQAYASGEPITFHSYLVSTDHLTEFQQAVINVVRDIPDGETRSYAEVAERAGSPKAARAVGNVMANNRSPIVVPCHRVLAAGGRWGGFTAPGGVDFKRRLLSLESNH